MINIFYSLAALVRKILFLQLEIKFISSRPHVISSMNVVFPHCNSALMLKKGKKKEKKEKDINLKYHDSKKGKSKPTVK